MNSQAIKKIFLAVLAGAVLLVGFQNCGEVRVAPAEQEEVASSAKTQFSATACPSSELLPAEATKFIFVVDMSVSNIGDWNKIPTGSVDSDGQPTYWAYFRKEGNTDLEGARFEAIKNFISTCGNLAGNQFAVIPFATQAGKIQVIDGKNTYSCSGKFGTGASASSDLDTLHRIQDEELPMYERWTNIPLGPDFKPGLLGATNYTAALTCVENMLVNDLTDPVSAAAAQNYEIFFVSDGLPKERAKTGCEKLSDYPTAADRERCYLEGIEKHISFGMQAAIGNQKKIKYHSLYYSKPTATSISQADIDKYMGAISRLGDTGTPLVLGSFTDSMKDGKNPLCDLLGVRSSVELRPEVMSIVNLNVKRYKGKLALDSDADGLSDLEEQEMGSDPLDPHSLLKPTYSDVLDGVCARLGGKSDCLQMRSQVTCRSTMNPLGLTDCDLQLLQVNNLYEHPTKGLDSDKDGLPDLVEILKGTDPGTNDMSADPDGDLINNRQEILLNRDPSVVDFGILANEDIQYSIQYLGQKGGACPYGEWQLTSSRMPGLMGKALTSSVVGLNHKAGENVFLIYYRSSPQNSATRNVELNAYFLKVEYAPKPGGFELYPAKMNVLPVDFSKLGEVQP